MNDNKFRHLGGDIFVAGSGIAATWVLLNDTQSWPALIAVAVCWSYLITAR